MSKSILVTGATGFLGSHVVKVLAKKNFVCITARYGHNFYRIEDCIGSVKVYEADLENIESFKKVFDEFQPEIVIHCAAYGVDYRRKDVSKMFKVNVEGTIGLFKLAAENGVKRFIHTGSCFEYSQSKYALFEDSPLRPFSMYGVSKVAGTLGVLQLGKELGVQTVVLRPFGMYGTHEGEHRFVPNLILSCLKDKEVGLTRGEQIRDYTYVDDVADAYVKLVDGEFPDGEIFNVGSGYDNEISIRYFGYKIAFMLGKKHLLKWCELEYRKDEPMSIVADSSKIEKMIGWKAKTGLDEGIKKTIEYYRGLYK